MPVLWSVPAVSDASPKGRASPQESSNCARIARRGRCGDYPSKHFLKFKGLTRGQPVASLGQRRKGEMTMAKGTTRAKRRQRILNLEESGGSVIYEGPSLIDGEPIVVIMTYGSSNEKTGDIHQTWILLQNTSPLDGVKNGQDESICGDCVHRPALAKGNGEARS